MAFLWYLHGLGDYSLWADEGATFGIASLGLRPYEHPSLYFRFMGIWMRIFGASEWSLRFPSAVSAALLPWFMYHIACRISGRRVAVYGAWLVAFSPFIRLGAQEARMYALLALFQAAAFLGIVLFLKGNRRGLLLWCAGTILSTRLHHLGWLGCWPPFVSALLVVKGRKSAYLAGLTALVLYGSLWTDLYGQVMHRIGGGHLGSTPGLAAVLKKFMGQVYYLGAGFTFTQIDGETLKSIIRGPWMPYFIVLGLVPLLILIRGMRSFIRLESRWSIPVISFFVPSFLFLAYEGSPANLLLPVALAYIYILAEGCSSMKRSVLGVVLILWFSAGIIQSRPRGYPIHPEDWRTLSREITEIAGDGDAVYLTGSRNSHFITDYYSLHDIPRYSEVDSTLLGADYDPHRKRSHRSVAGKIRRLLEDHHRLWFVYIDYDMPFMERTLDTLRTMYSYEFRTYGSGLSVYLFEKSGVRRQESGVRRQE